MLSGDFPDTPPFQRVRGYLDRLRAEPPRSLLLEGGSGRERLQAALHWARLLNCTGEGMPCLTCSACVQIGADAFRDLFILDGGQGSIKIDDVREVRRVMGEPPRGNGCRVIILAEAQELTIEAANSLLKNMEEPLPGNVFVLTTPQRERLLPTLVSRSFVLTLPWPERDAALESPSPDGTADGTGSGAGDDVDYMAWKRDFYRFCRTGRGWFPTSSAKGVVNRARAELFLTLLQADMAAVLSGQAAETDPARELLRDLDLPDFQDSPQSAGVSGRSSLARLDAALASALEAVAYRANPALTLDWLAVTINGWLSGGRAD